MLSRQARSSLAVRRAAVSAPTGASLRRSLLAAPRLGHRHVVSLAQRPWLRRGAEAGHDTLQGRTMATAVDDFRFDRNPYGPPPSAALPPFPGSPLRSHDFDPSSLLVVPEPTPCRPTAKVNRYGIPGDVDEMIAIFDACIRVGRLERAGLVLKRFNAMDFLSGEERIVLNNEYLRASMQQMRTNPSLSKAEELHKWYELQIRNTGLPQTAETIACMLKVSLLSERGPRLERLVQRYMGMAPDEAGLLVLGMADILSDQDLAVITDICPTYNLSREEVSDEESSPTKDELEHVDRDAPPAQGTESLSRDSMPELRETPQSGHGLIFLKKGLGLLANLEDVNIAKLPMSDRRQIQIQLERSSIDLAVEKWREVNKNLQSMGITTALSASPSEGSLSQLAASWMQLIEARIKEDLNLVEASEGKSPKAVQDLERCLYGPILQQSEPARLAAVTILAVLNLGAVEGLDSGVVVTKLVTHVAKLVQEDIEMQRKAKAQKLERRKNVRFTGQKEESKEQPEHVSPSKQRGPRLANKNADPEPTISIIDSPKAKPADEEKGGQPWPLTIRVQVGSFLVKSLIETAKVKVTTEHPATREPVSQYQAAFMHLTQNRRGKRTGVLFFNSELIEQLKREPIGDFMAKHLPMIVEPRPWRRFGEGGLLESVTSLVRVKSGDVEQRLYTKAAIKCGDMKQVFKGLDVLGKTAWRINTDTLNVMVEAWNSGEKIANMPPLSPQFTIPPEPDSSEDPLLRRKWMRAVRAIENERSGLHSQRCFMNLQLEIARAFRHQTIYFPHNVDYRGRAYPMPSYLNHMGADHTRAILKFARGKELGTRGLRWLKIHLANVYGLDKSSFDEREAFADENVAEIIDSATNPLKGNRWWLKAEDPWQCLSACFELKAALELSDPTKFVSHLPIHQDGTCNGLQHYAALGGDMWGARQVNLEPGDRPADVYSAVADLVKEAINKDAAAKDKFGVTLQGKVTRKVVKQTVMTNVYGVTFAGAKKQVCKQIDALYPDLGKQTGIPHLLLSTYIAKHIFNALATMFRGAHDIQYWLGSIGGRVCRALTPAQLQQIADSYAESAAKDGPRAKRAKKSSSAKKKGFDELAEQFRSTIVWTTPLRMPVAQPYRKPNTREIRTTLQSVVLSVHEQTDPVNRRKQLQGFPPNFIHSLDASHMLLSALRCDELGLNFAAVHDSFWTHAADVDTMNGVLRDAFIRIHEEDVVGRLAAEFEARHKGSIYLAHIDATTPVAKKIKELRKKSGMSPEEELLLEHKRNTLRQSGTPWDLEAAKQIVTPASVYEEMSAAEVDIGIQEDSVGIGLGEIGESEEAEADKAVRERTEGDDEAALDDSALDDSALDGAALDDGDVDAAGDTEAAQEAKRRAAEDADLRYFEAAIRERPSTVRTTKRSRALPIWLPLTIPPVPKKGDFDVKRLRESKYFFS